MWGAGVGLGREGYGVYLLLESLLHTLQTAVHQSLDKVSQSLLGFCRYSLLRRVTGGREGGREGGGGWRAVLPGLISWLTVNGEKGCFTYLVMCLRTNIS